MSTLIKTSVRLLFRTKGFWFFLILAPILSTVILKSKFDSSAAYVNRKDEIIEMENASDKVAYYGSGGEYIVKVYDGSDSELSEYMLNKLAKNGLFTVCRAKVSDDFDIDDQIKKDGEEDRMGVALYLPKDFDERAITGDYAKVLTVYTLSDDSRNEALMESVKTELSLFANAPVMAEERDASSVLDTLANVDDNLPNKEVESIGGKDSRELSIKQVNQKTQIGYAFAFMTLGFVFCGIFVAHTVIKEEKNDVLKRIKLTKTSTLKYFASKFIVAAIISVMITVVVAGFSFFLTPDDIGMSRLKFIAMMFMLGLIFCTLSMLVGILMGEVMSANVAAFTLWSMSALLSGLYFPLDYTSPFLKTLSLFLPQKWFMDSTEMILVNDNGAFVMLICITVAYMVVILSLGSIGLKVKRTEQ